MKRHILAAAVVLASGPVTASTTAEGLAQDYSSALGGSAGVTRMITNAQQASNTCDIVGCAGDRTLPSLSPPADNSGCGVLTADTLAACFNDRTADSGWVRGSNTQVRLVGRVASGVYYYTIEVQRLYLGSPVGSVYDGMTVSGDPYYGLTGSSPVERSMSLSQAVAKGYVTQTGIAMSRDVALTVCNYNESLARAGQLVVASNTIWANSGQAARSSGIYNYTPPQCSYGGT